MASGIWKIFGTKGAESAQNQWIEPLAAAHNPEVEGSNPSPATKANGDTVFEKCCITIRFLLIQANGGGGQCVLILYGDQADTEFLQAIHVRIGVQVITAQPGHALYAYSIHPPV